MKTKHVIQIIDTHAGGDVSRIVIGGIKDIPADTVRGKMEYLSQYADGLRVALLSEPYGIPEMSVDLIVPPSNKEAKAGYIIMEEMGYPIYSGSNTICTATALLESGLVEKKEGFNYFKLESPASLVEIEAFVKDGIVESVTCEGLPSYIAEYKNKIYVPNYGEVTYSIAYSGGYYALVDAKELGFNLVKDEENALRQCAYAIVEEINKTKIYNHYDLGFVGKLPFLHFMGEVEKIIEGEYRSRSTTYVHPGVICRSTTGTGTSARLAFLNYEGKIKEGDKLETVSLRNTKFVGEFCFVEKKFGFDIVKNKIFGRSYILAKSDIFIDLTDPILNCDTISMITY
ncbi:MAG: proline racemase family protein [Sulfurospirillaceae bacterium]|nr:proline racemase family protein [Sulfurospirillaceae bacterium]